MPRRIVIIDGHPDPDSARLCHGLAEAYAAGAEEGGHDVRRLDVASLDFPLLRTADDFETGSPPDVIADAQQTIEWAEHIVIVYPLWLGTMPALLKGFLEQVFRPGFAFERNSGSWPASRLKGRSARVVVTMGMPAFVYRWYFWAHSLKSLERNILRFGGISPVRETLIGGAGDARPETRERWLAEMRTHGHAAR